MSENELHIGKLRVFTKIQGESDIDTLKRVMKQFDKEFNQEEFEYWDNDINTYLGEENLFEDIFYVGGKFYINEEHKKFDDLYVDNIEKNSDGSYSYMMGFYNGGTCLTEMLQEGLERVNKEN